MRKLEAVGALVLTVTAVAALAACHGSQGPTAKSAPGGSTDPANWPADDRSMCDYKHPGLESNETAGPGALKPNVRRVYRMEGEGDARRKTLVCREIDTNLDGIKDVVRSFNAKGEPVREDADTNYDGKIDSWSTFVGGRMSEEDLDTNHDGRPDQWKYYTDGQLSRWKRDRNNDGRPDVWEIYSSGHLERVGYDDDYDGHVDRWDRDDEVRANREAAQEGRQDAGTTADAAAAPAAATADAGR
jgi:hypothetical protein